MINVVNGNEIPLWIAIRRFCGFPMGVMVLPTEIPKASEMSKTTDRIPICFEMYIIRGIPSNAIVSFTKNAESIPIPKTNINNSDLTSLALVNIRIAINFSIPDLSSAVTMLNIPNRNPITSRLIDFTANSKEIT